MIDWHEYEVRKKLLPNNLTCEEYEAAIQKILEEMENKQKKGRQIIEKIFTNRG